ncbi:type I restriction endonuclease, partial [Escherichia coli]|uniref:type I restriction endonuclease n=1 Tax=Escherichia coli TaxID=562 RepID=UPI003EDFCF98
MKFTEDTRVKIPVILHLIRLGYHYLSLKEQRWDKETNIFPDLFTAAIGRINPGLAPDDIGRLLKDLTLLLDNDDLGRAFFEKLSDRSGIKLIDFDNFNNNSFQVVTELTCENGDEEFRPEFDREIVDIVDYVMNYEISSRVAYDTAHYCLLDTLGCGLE